MSLSYIIIYNQFDCNVFTKAHISSENNLNLITGIYNNNNSDSIMYTD